MNTLEFLSYLRSLDIQLIANGERLRINAPREVLTPALRHQLRERKNELIVFLQNSHVVDASMIPIEPVSKRQTLPLSFAQQRLWLLTQMEEHTGAYNICNAWHITGLLDIGALGQAMSEIISRHEVLRTTFSVIDGQPVQLIAPPPNRSHIPPLSIIEFNAADFSSSEAQWAKVNQLIRQEAEHPFNLTLFPLIRVKLLCLNTKEHVLVITAHHIIYDDWSTAIFMQELLTLYKAFLKHEPSPLPKLPVQYVDFAVWQRKWLQDEILDYHLNYWLNQLQGVRPFLELPTDHPRPRMQSFNGKLERFELTAELTQRLKELSQQANATLFMTLLAAFNVLLYRYSGQQDIVVGTPITNRNQRDTESLIGFFVNTLALRSQLYDNPPFMTLLEQVRQVTLEAYNHQDLPFEKLVEVLQPERNASYSTIFQVMFILKHDPMPPVTLPGLLVKPLEIEDHNAKFDLTLEMEEEDGMLKGNIEYNTDLFEQSTINHMVKHFITLLKGIVASPELAVSKLPLLTDEEQHKVLVEWNQNQTDYPVLKQTIVELFEEQVKQRSNAIAIAYEGEVLTYGELNRQANQLAHYLQSLGVGREVPVGISMERSLEMIVGLLGILKAGGIYVPLEPSYPKQRLAFMIEDAKVEYLLSQERLLNQLSEVAHDGAIICLDRDRGKIAHFSAQNPAPLSGDRGLYMIYTSGSTGKPKGVLGGHQGALNRFLWMWESYPFSEGEICCQKTSLSFVDSVWEIFGPLLKGIPTVLIPDPIIAEPKEFVEYLAKNRVSRLVLVPSLLRVILDHENDLQSQLPNLKYWTSSGETLPVELYKRFMKAMPEAILLNIYGSSEVSADATCYDSRDAQQAEFSKVPIGRPISNIQIYILDRHRQLMPIGLPGELYIGGVGLAKGYVGHPDLSKECFIPNPFGKGRLYKSGDLGRYLPDGKIEFLGRLDHQVKIRGIRIELAEIEQLLSQHPAVREVVVMARDDKQTGDKELVAYLVADLSVERVQWQSRCQIELPTGQQLKLAVSDLSSNGIGLQNAPEFLNVGQKVRCALQLPSQFEPKWFEGKIIWRDNESQAAGILFESNSIEAQILRQNVKQMAEVQCGLVRDMRHRTPRVPLHTTCVVELGKGIDTLNGKKVNTLTENISVGGIRLNTKGIRHTWQTAQKLTLHLQLPDSRKDISLEATVMWLNPTTEQVGLKFHASQEQSSLLKQTVEYLTSTQGLSLAHLRHYIKQYLPETMLPSSFVIMDHFPLSPNGKINRLALPAPEGHIKQAKFENGYLAPRDELELQLSKIWEKIFNRGQIGVRDNFFELGGHSLMAITLVSEIEKITNRRLPLTALLESATIEQLTSKLRQEGYQPSWSSLVPLQAGGSKEPFFFVVPIMVSVLNLKELSKHMAPDRPFYGLQAQGLDGKQPIHTTIEEMAAHYIKEIKSLQPEGPYLLGGHCAGSWIAFEMAQQLKEQGELVGALIMIDAEPPNFTPPTTDLRYYLNRGLHYLQEGRLYYALEWKVKQRLEKKLSTQLLSSQQELLEKVRAIHKKAYDNYTAPSYAGEMLLLRGDEWNSLKNKSWHKNWELLITGKVEFDIIPGAPSEMLNEPNVRILAQKIKSYLDRS